MKKQCKYFMGICFLMLLMLLLAPIQTEAADLNKESMEQVKGNMDWRWPVPSSNTLSSCYIDGRDHYALDIYAPEGDLVYACFEGEVIKTFSSCPHNYGKSYDCGCEGGLGNYVYIHHIYNGVDYVSRYGHLTSVDVSVGDLVTKDTIIGTIGSTGISANYHLDLRIYRGCDERQEHEDCVDPLLDFFLEVPEGINANRASTGCCYTYVCEVKEVCEAFKVQKEAEELARQEAEKKAFESAMRNWVESELLNEHNYFGTKLVDVKIGLKNFVENYK